ncbi:MAG: hypothetical protein PHC91_11555, partial [Eubacteriales bacterium]|nr:hypothetical protein [Eubacteriales bacterium]
MKTRPILILLFTCILIASSTVTASAANQVDSDDMAIYINGNFSGQSAIIHGSLYSANGSVQFNSATDNVVTGSIYHKEGTSFTIPQYYNPEFISRVAILDSTQFNEAYPEIIDTPDLSNQMGSLVLNPNSTVLTIAESTHYEKLTVGQNVIVDTSEGNIFLVVDELTCKNSYHITLQGSGKL